jgi:hypothetical protein
MGWNDHYDPSEYDPSDLDSMQALAMRSIRDHGTPAPTPDPNDPDVGECWDCGRVAKLYRKGLCATCKIADMY